jgi:hypothetical protein
MPKSISKEKKLDWETKIREQKTSGLSVNQWCRKNQISKGSFHYWKDRLYSKPNLTRANFTELSPDQGSGICIEYQGIRIFVEKSFDPITLRSCLAAVRGL